MASNTTNNEPIFDNIVSGAMIAGNYLVSLFTDSQGNQLDPSGKLDTDLNKFFGGHAVVFITRPEINITEDGKFNKESSAGFGEITDKGTPVTIGDNLENEGEKFAEIFSERAPNLLNDVTGGALYGITNTFKGSPGDEEQASLPTIAGTTLSSKEMFIPDLSTNLRGIQFQNVGLSYDTFVTNLQQSKYSAPIKKTGESGITFSMTFAEDHDVRVTKIIKTWIEYINAVTTGKGNVVPSLRNLLQNKIDYKSSVYVFLMKPNLKEIIFFSKYTGVMPTNIPLSMLTYNAEEQNDVKLDIEFIADDFTFLDDSIIVEFNKLIGSSGVRIVQNPKEKYRSYMFTDLNTPSADDGQDFSTQRYNKEQ